MLRQALERTGQLDDTVFIFTRAPRLGAVKRRLGRLAKGTQGRAQRSCLTEMTTTDAWPSLGLAAHEG